MKVGTDVVGTIQAKVLIYWGEWRTVGSELEDCGNTYAHF